MPDQAELSKRQQQILAFIEEVLQEQGYAPTVREIAEHVGSSSPTPVHRHLRTLEQRGYITRDVRIPRSIQLVHPRKGLLLLGRVPAGVPIDAIEDAEYFDLESEYNADDHFLLRVQGDSMIEDHIANGDLVVVHRQPTCENGDIAVVRLDDDEVTLKRFYREKNRIRLQPANETMRPIYRKEVEIVGVVAGVIRQM